MNKRYNYLLPLIFAVVLAVGMFLGSKINFGSGSQSKLPFKNKLQEILLHINASYVDTVNNQQLEETAIVEMLMKLDPHSAYIPARDMIAMRQDMQGDFEGIGVEFNILNDTLVVVSPISGGPSEALGIMAGDKIIYIDNQLVAGTGIKNEDVRKKLMGKKGTEVKIKIMRNGQKKLIEYTIVRDKIPIVSIEAAYMVNGTIGYIKINRFSAKTTDEFGNAILSLKQSGMKDLILDLSGNPGGYLNVCSEILNQFFDSKQLLVYTEGRKRPRENYYSTGSGMFSKGKVVVIIDEGSASASEIMAGAIQDHDRGVILGRRSFGKGLVQEPITLSDHSELRLTIARYYTPSGRFIQKPYNNGAADYYMEMYHRFQDGEVYSKDSNKFPDTLKYKTDGGRIVYGGGGIMPDVFVPLDTIGSTAWYGEVARSGIISKFTFKYVDENRIKLLKMYPDKNSFIKSFNTSEIESLFYVYALKEGAKRDDNAYKRSSKLITTQIKALMARQLYGNYTFYEIINQTNPEFIKAVEIIGSAQYNSILQKQK